MPSREFEFSVLLEWVHTFFFRTRDKNYFLASFHELMLSSICRAGRKWPKAFYLYFWCASVSNAHYPYELLSVAQATAVAIRGMYEVVGMIPCHCGSISIEKLCRFFYPKHWVALRDPQRVMCDQAPFWELSS